MFVKTIFYDIKIPKISSKTVPISTYPYSDLDDFFLALRAME